MLQTDPEPSLGHRYILTLLFIILRLGKAKSGLKYKHFSLLITWSEDLFVVCSFSKS